jgi:hypothetical protein
MGFRKLLLSFSLLFSTLFSYAQVTSSSLSGTVRSDQGELLSGASLLVVHTPTGTTYRVTSGKGGTFNLTNIPSGGPYMITTSFLGYQENKQAINNLPIYPPGWYRMFPILPGVYWDLVN